ncbi:LacI family DNA-binding transcriptional regulator [Tessaracoccus sp. Z1128]
MVRRVDVARLAGVTPAVVSYVTNGSHPVSAATRRKVEEAIEELGYRPNAVARALAISRTHTIGLIVPAVANPFFAELASAIEAAAFAAGYTVVVGNASDEGRHVLDYVHTFADRQVDGLVVVPITDSAQDALAAARGRGIPVVFTDRAAGVDVPTVSVDNVDGARAAALHLAEHGRLVHACITGSADAPPALDRVIGWRAGLEQAGVHVDEGLVVHTPFTAEAGYDAARALIVSRPDVDAVLVGSDLQAIGVLRAIFDAGKLPGADIALASFDGITAGRYTYPRLTTVAQPLAAVATAIIELLAGLIESREDGADLGTTRILSTQLVIRESCGCPPQTP